MSATICRMASQQAIVDWRLRPLVSHHTGHQSCRKSVRMCAGAGRGRGRPRYLDFDWDGNVGSSSMDDLEDSKIKYEDFIFRQDKPAAPAGGYGYTGMGTRGGFYNSRRRPMSSRPPYGDSLYDFDEFEDEFEDARPPPPRETEKRFMNGKHVLTNTEITAPLLRIIGAEKEQLGMKPRDEALMMAMDQDMDLILINPEQAPPVARIIQWSKYKFEIEQADKTRKAKANVVETKEVRLKPKTDDNDLATKVKSAQKFLEKGDKVKLCMKFEGRQLQFKEVGKEVLLKFIADLGETAKVEGPLNFKGNTYQVMLVPGKTSSGGGGGGGNSQASSSNSSKPAAAAAAAPTSSATAAAAQLPPRPPQQAPAPAAPVSTPPPSLPPRPPTIPSDAAASPSPSTAPAPASAPAASPGSAPGPMPPVMPPRPPAPPVSRPAAAPAPPGVPPMPNRPPMPAGMPARPATSPGGPLPMPMPPGRPLAAPAQQPLQVPVRPLR